MTKTKKVRRILLRVLLILSVTLLFVYPFWWMIVNSLNTSAQVFGKQTLLPVSWRWENYKEIFQIQPFGRHLLNSILVALIGTVGNVIIAAFSGYAFARIRFPGREILFILLLTALMMPIEVIQRFSETSDADPDLRRTGCVLILYVPAVFYHHS